MTDKPYTPETIDIRVAYRFMEAGLMMDPNSKPHDPEEMAEHDAEFDRWFSQVRDEAKAEALRDFADSNRLPFIMFQDENYTVTVSDLLRGQARRYLEEPDEYSKEQP